MAVWKLDGPTDVQNLTNESVFLNFGEWYPYVGLLASGGGLSSLGVVTLDGVYQHRATFIHNLTSHWPDRKKMVSVESRGGKWLELWWEPIAFMTQATSPDEVDFSIPSHTNYVRLTDRRVYTSFQRIHGIKDGVDTIEGPLLPGFSGASPFTHPGRNLTEVFISCGGVDPHGVFYDTERQVLSSKYIYIDQTPAGLICQGLMYAPEYGVLVSTYASINRGLPDVKFQIIVWSLEVRPTQLTNPEVF